jgi:hypothetical protein
MNIRLLLIPTLEKLSLPCYITIKGRNFMTQEQQNLALKEVMDEESIATPDQTALFDLFEAFLKTKDENGNDLPNLPRGFGQ